MLRPAARNALGGTVNRSARRPFVPFSTVHPVAPNHGKMPLGTVRRHVGLFLAKAS